VALVHVIIVLRLKYVIVEAVVVIERVVQQVDIMVVPVELCGVVIINQAVLVVMIVFNNQLLVVITIVKPTKVGGTVRHEKKTK
jgi:hypothetical protein